VLVGDFRTAEVKPLLERYFGRIPRGRTDPPPVVTLEPRQIGEKRYAAEAETSPTLRVWWHAVPFVHRDRVALDLLSDLMSGRTGRLYKGLVLGRKVANEASAAVDLKKYDGVFTIEVTVKDGQDPADAEKALFEEVERLQKEPVPAEELQKVKNQAKANAYRRLSAPFSIAIQLMFYEGLGDWRYINTYADEVDAVTAADIQRLAAQHLTKENRTVGVFLRKGEAAPPDPALDALPAELQAMVRQGLQQIAAETDPAKMREGITGLEASLERAPADVRPGLEILLARAKERLAALEGGKK
jgi:predicted Zn-dependent peptidase